MKKYIIADFSPELTLMISKDDMDLLGPIVEINGYHPSSEIPSGYIYRKDATCDLLEISEDGKTYACDPIAYIKWNRGISDVRKIHVEKLLHSIETGEINFDEVFNFEK